MPGGEMSGGGKTGWEKTRGGKDLESLRTGMFI